MSGIVVEKQEIERIYLGLAIQAQKQIPNLQNPKKRVIILAGPTGCGKSAFAMELSESIGGEIISGDAMQVYRGMDIGTAKPTLQDQARVPHHLYDIRNIDESFSVVDFYYEARHCCQIVNNRDNIPIVTGGSGFYLHSFLYGPPSGPPSVPEVRKQLEEEINKFGAAVLYERLRQLDAQYANTITVNDKQKIVRALEIIALTGKKVSRLSWKGRIKPQGYDFRCWFLYRPREHLYDLIDQRCDRMLSQGFLEEVVRLEKEGLRNNPTASQAIGYRQALDFLDTDRTYDDYCRFVEEFKKASRHYAKKQFTWFRPEREPLFRWLNLDMHEPKEAIRIIEEDFFSR